MSKESHKADQRRNMIVKVRLNELEALEIDARCRASGMRTRAGYLRDAALGHATENPLAELIGEIGLTLNQLDKPYASELRVIAGKLDQIISLMQAGQEESP